MIHRFLVLIIFTCATLTTTAQLAMEHLSFKVNNIGQILVLDEKGVDLYSSKGEVIKHHSEELLGRISSMDRSSSLKTLIFYDDIPGFQILDNTLSPHGSLYDLNLAGFENVSNVCMSNDNTFWAYDAVTFEVLRFNENFDILERSGNLAVIVGDDLNPISMMISNNRLFIADSAKGVFVFDLFANFLLRIPYENMTDMDVTTKWIYMTDGRSIQRVDWKGIILETTELDSSSPILTFDVKSDIIYLGDGKSIEKLSLNSLFE